MLADLEVSGYRPITLASYYELIGGCRYVSIETDGLVTQYTPDNPRAQWCLWHWYNGVSRRDGEASRSGLGELPINSQTEWFGKACDRVGFSVFEFNHRLARAYHNHEQTFAQFISECIGGDENPYEIAGAFNAKHPVAERDRAVADLRRAEAELRGDQERMRHFEAFREAEMTRLAASELERAGLAQEALYMRQRADNLRATVQARLDAEAQRSISSYRPPQTYTIVPSFRMLPLQQDSSWTSDPSPIIEQPKKSKLEIAQPTGKRAFMLDEEE